LIWIEWTGKPLLFYSPRGRSTIFSVWYYGLSKF